MRTITEDRPNDLVTIDDVSISGWLEDGECAACSQRLVFYEKYDSLFCAQCNEWQSSKCSDHNCTYCSGRPHKPL